MLSDFLQIQFPELKTSNWRKENLRGLFHFALQLLYSLVSVTCVTAVCDANHTNAQPGAAQANFAIPILRNQCRFFHAAAMQSPGPLWSALFLPWPGSSGFWCRLSVLRTSPMRESESRNLSRSATSIT